MSARQQEADRLRALRLQEEADRAGRLRRQPNQDPRHAAPAAAALPAAPYQGQQRHQQGNQQHLQQRPQQHHQPQQHHHQQYQQHQGQRPQQYQQYQQHQGQRPQQYQQHQQNQGQRPQQHHQPQQQQGQHHQQRQQFQAHPQRDQQRPQRGHEPAQHRHGNHNRRGPLGASASAEHVKSLRELLRYGAPLTEELVRDKLMPVLTDDKSGELPEADLSFVIKQSVRMIESLPNDNDCRTQLLTSLTHWPGLAQRWASVAAAEQDAVEHLATIAERVSTQFELHRLASLNSLRIFAETHRRGTQLHVAVMLAIEKARETVGARPARHAREGQVQQAKARSETPVLPTGNELLENPKAVRRHLPVLTATPLDSLDAHLDALYALTREDFLLPLREGIVAARNLVQGVRFHTEEEKKLQRQRQLQAYSYEHVEFTGLRLEPVDGFVFGFRAYQPPAPRAPIQFKKRLMDGNLLVITPWQDKHTKIGESSLFGVVRRRKVAPSVRVTPLDRGEFDVSFAESETDIATLLQFFPRTGMRYHMIESKAYFLPVSRVLTQLRNLSPDQLHAFAPAFQRGIEGPFFKPTPLSLHGAVHCIPGSPGSLMLGRPFDDLRRDAEQTFSAWTAQLEEELKGTAHHHVVDGTQRDALALAFSSNVPLIQGTPGTGKTFIGGKIVQLMLANRLITKDSSMLVVSLTQHALDSFTLDLLAIEHPDNIIRIGRQSKNQVIADAKITFADKLLKHIPRRSVHGAEAKLRSLAQQKRRLLAEDRISDKDLEEVLGALCINPTWSDFVYALIEENRAVIAQLEADYDILKKELHKLESITRQKRSTERAKCDAERDLRQLPSRQRCTALQVEFERELQRLRKVQFIGSGATACNKLLNDLIQLTTQEVDKHVRQNRRRTEAEDAIEAANQKLAQIAQATARLAAVEKEIDAVNAELERQGYGYDDWRNALGGSTPRPLAAAPSTAAAVPLSDHAANHDMGDAPLREDSDASDDEGYAEYEAAQEAEQRDRIDRVEQDETPALDLGCDTNEDDVQGFAAWFGKTDPNRCGTAAERQYAHQGIRALIALKLNADMRDLVRKVDAERQASDEKEANEKVNLLRRHRIITATTAGAALLLPLLHRVNIAVVMIEEAGEVPESHVLACLPRTAQQLILVGDSRQLPPKVNDGELARKHGLEMSMMERLEKLKLRHVTLTTQRRMNPSLSRLVHRYYLEKERVQIVDHPSTVNRLGIHGVPPEAQHLCWIESRHSKEAVSPGMQSPLNAYEAELSLCIAQYLSFHLGRENVTILTPYKGQLMKLIDLCKNAHIQWSGRSEPGALRISTIDDYQGEECDAIVLTLVRTDMPGFLTKDNRACVALSRAKRFLCIVGSSGVMAEANEIWKDANQRCRDEGILFDAFPARCERHNNSMPFRNLAEFRRNVNPHGGCQSMCRDALPCGHHCTLLCHIELQKTHEDFKCQAPCGRIGGACNPPRACAHPCLAVCSADCPACQVTVDDVLLACGEHRTSTECWRATSVNGRDLPKCAVPITRRLDCDHDLEAPCGEWPRDGGPTPPKLQKKCRKPCSLPMPCGHPCFQLCHQGVDVNHEAAMKKCRRDKLSPLPCGHGMVQHACNKPVPKCTAACGKQRPCGHPCEAECGHAESCEVASPCRAVVSDSHPTCGHAIERECGQHAAHVQCGARCDVPLACGHPCGGKCFECVSDKGWPAHPPCRFERPLKLACGHECVRACSEENAPCSLPCSRRCPHSDCRGQHPCGECPGIRCEVECAWQCPHNQCSQRCCDPCEREPCTEPCGELLDCGHPCSGCCGERCPELCLRCVQAALPAKLVHFYTVFTDDDAILHFCQTGELPEDLVDTPASVQLIELRCGCTFFREELENIFAAARNVKREVSVVYCPNKNCSAVISPGDVLMFHGTLTTLADDVDAVRQARRKNAGGLLAQAENVLRQLSQLIDAVIQSAELQPTVRDEVLAAFATPYAPSEVKPTEPTKSAAKKNPQLKKQYAERLTKWKASEKERVRLDEDLNDQRRRAASQCDVISAGWLTVASRLSFRLVRPTADFNIDLAVALAHCLSEWRHAISLYQAARGASPHDVQLVRMMRSIGERFEATAMPPTAEALKLIGQYCRHVGLFARTAALTRGAARVAAASREGRAGASLLPYDMPNVLGPNADIRDAVLRLIASCVAKADRYVSGPFGAGHAFFVENQCLRRNCAALRRFLNGVTATFPDGHFTPEDFCFGFHGTAMQAVSNILCQGFDPRRRAGQAFGPGEYFAQHMQMSMGYVKGGAQFMIVNLIIKSRTTEGAVLVVNNPVERPQIQFQLPIGVAIFGAIDACGHADYDCCITPPVFCAERLKAVQDTLLQAIVQPGRALDESTIDREITELEKMCQVQPPTRAELVEITRAMGLTSGHAFKCPNGHLYFIADCGGAMMESQCNECGARIGGGSHALRGDNTFAGGDIDDGASPSWPTMGRW